MCLLVIVPFRCNFRLRLGCFSDFGFFLFFRFRFVGTVFFFLRIFAFLEFRLGTVHRLLAYRSRTGGGERARIRWWHAIRLRFVVGVETFHLPIPLGSSLFCPCLVSFLLLSASNIFFPLFFRLRIFWGRSSRVVSRPLSVFLSRYPSPLCAFACSSRSLS